MIKFASCLITGDEKDSSIKSSRMLSAKSTPNFHHTHQFLSPENAEPKLHPNPTYAGSLSANASSSDLSREKMAKVDDFTNVPMKMSAILCMCSLMYKHLIAIDWNKVQNLSCCMHMKNINLTLPIVNCWYKSEVYFSKKKNEHTCISLLSVKSTQPHFLTKKFRNTLKKPLSK